VAWRRWVDRLRVAKDQMGYAMSDARPSRSVKVSLAPMTQISTQPSRDAASSYSLRKASMTGGESREGEGSRFTVLLPRS
jgi:hypothetical protein